MKRLFKSKKAFVAGAAIPSPNAKIIFTKAPFMQYEQLLLHKNSRQYLGKLKVSKKILGMGAQKNTYTKNMRNKYRAKLIKY